MSKFISVFFVGIALLGVGAEVQAQDDLVCTRCVDGSDIRSEAVTTNKIKRKAVTNAKLADKSITSVKIASGVVTRSKIKNRAVNADKLSSDIVDTLNGSIGGIVLEQMTQSDGSGVVSFSCPANSLVASANCFCTSDGGTRNLGVLFSCSIAGNGGVGACFDYFFDDQLPATLVELTLVCVSAVQNDGTPIVPTLIGVNPLGISKIDNSGVDLETAVNNARSEVAAHRNALQNR